jgi:hypothetical protein
MLRCVIQLGGRLGQKSLQGVVDAPVVVWIESGHVGTVAPVRWDRQQAGIVHLRDLQAVVFHLEVQVAGAGHGQRTGVDRAKRTCDLAAVQRVSAD